MRQMRPSRIAALGGALMLLTFTASACDDFLAVENTMAPNREDATQDPSDLEAFMGGGFHPNMFDALHDDEDATAAFPLQAAEFTATMDGQGSLLQYNDHVAEPRGVHDNGAVVSLGNGPQGPRDVWADVMGVNSVVHDGLEILDGGVVIEQGGVDVTARARAFAKLMQGWSWGYAGLVWDQAVVIPESTSLPASPDALRELTVESFRPYQEVIQAAVDALQEAANIAQQSPGVVQYPSFTESNLWFGTPEPLSSATFIQLANTLSARFLVLAARTPSERETVDWAAVLDYTANGLTSDFEIQLSNSRNSNFLNHFTNVSNGDRNYRWDYRAIGPADQSGNYQDWISSPLDQRDRFQITTPDRRITGATPDSDGAYTAYHEDDNGFTPSRGTYSYSAYQWRRHAFKEGIEDPVETGYNLGAAVFVSKTENDLLRAEALARTGDAAGAAELVNLSRTSPAAQLPPATPSGVQGQEDCVPRLDSGECGNLLATIRYERMIELAGLDMIRGYADSRGWGKLADGTPMHYPVPGNELDILGLGNYTFGGVGREGSATYAPVP